METSTKNYEHVYKTIQKSLKEYLDTYGIKNVVLGISGGIDSTVVAAIVDMIVLIMEIEEGGEKK